MRFDKLTIKKRTINSQRPLKRLVQRLIQDPLAMRILEGEFPEGSNVSVGAPAAGDSVEFRKV